MLAPRTDHFWTRRAGHSRAHLRPTNNDGLENADGRGCRAGDSKTSASGAARIARSAIDGARRHCGRSVVCEKRHGASDKIVQRMPDQRLFCMDSLFLRAPLQPSLVKTQPRLRSRARTLKEVPSPCCGRANGVSTSREGSVTRFAGGTPPCERAPRDQWAKPSPVVWCVAPDEPGPAADEGSEYTGLYRVCHALTKMSRLAMHRAGGVVHAAIQSAVTGRAWLTGSRILWPARMSLEALVSARHPRANRIKTHFRRRYRCDR